MIFPPRFILIDQSNCQAVFALSIKPMTNALWLNYSFNYFTRPLTDSIRQSFRVNESNYDYFKLLPVEKRFEHSISLTDCEMLNINLQKLLSTHSSDFNRQIQTTLPQIQLYLFYPQIYSMYNYITSFVQNYTYWQSQYLQNASQQSAVQEVKQELPKFEPTFQQNTAEVVVETHAIDTEPHKNTDLSVLITEALKLAPHDNNITPYFIAKYVDVYLKKNVFEKSFEMMLSGDTLWIKIIPLIDGELLTLSERHYNTFIEIYNCFDYTIDEYHVRMREIVKFIIHLIKMYYDNTEDNKKSIIIPLKILEFLMFIYSMKVSNKGILHIIPHEFDGLYEDFEKGYTLTVNNFINVCLNSIDKSTLPFHKIMFFHPAEGQYLFEDTNNDEIINEIFKKESYLLTVNQEDFINLVYLKTKTKIENNEETVSNLLLNNPKLIDIDLILKENSQEHSNTMLDYKLITPEEKRFNRHKIITPEYFQLLKIATTPSISLALVQKDLTPLLALNCDTILQNIFKELNSLDTNNAITSLHLLTTYIRPFLPENSSVKTEMFILYRTVIPYIYDLCKVTKFLDYFH